MARPSIISSASTSLDRHWPEHHVGDRLGQDAADTEHDVGAELRVANHTGDQLAIARDHRRDQQRHVAVGGRRLGEQLRRGLAHRRTIAEPQPDQAAFGLVGDRVTAQLERNRVAELVGSRDGGRGVGDLALVGATATPWSRSSALDAASDRVPGPLTRFTLGEEVRALAGFSHLDLRAPERRAEEGGDVVAPARGTRHGASGSSSSKPPRNGESEK